MKLTFYRHALIGAHALGSSRKKEKKYSSQRKRVAIVDLFEGLWSVGTRFRHYHNASLSPEQKHWLFHSLPLFTEVSILNCDTPVDIIACGIHSWRTQIGATDVKWWPRYGKERRDDRCWLGGQLLESSLLLGDFSCCINPYICERQWRGRWGVSRVGDDSRYSKPLSSSRFLSDRRRHTGILYS